MRIFKRRLGAIHGRLRCGRIGYGGFVVLRADRIDAHEFGGTLRRQLRRLQFCHGAVIGRLVQAIVDVVENLAGFYVAALSEAALLDDAVDLRADFRDEKGTRSPRQCPGQRHGLSCQCHDSDLALHALGSAVGLGAAATQHGA